MNAVTKIEALASTEAFCAYVEVLRAAGKKWGPTVSFTPDEVDIFIDVTGDTNKAHSRAAKRRIVPGLMIQAYLPRLAPAVTQTVCPGFVPINRGLHIDFNGSMVPVGSKLQSRFNVFEIRDERRLALRLEFIIVNAEGKKHVAQGGIQLLFMRGKM